MSSIFFKIIRGKDIEETKKGHKLIIVKTGQQKKGFTVMFYLLFAYVWKFL